MFAKKLKKFITISAKVNRHGRNFPKPIAFLKFLKARQQWRVPVFSSVRRTNAIPHRTSHQLVAARAAPARLPPPPTRPHHHDQAFLECPCLQFGYAWVHLLSIGPCSVEDSRNLIKICQWLLEIDICADRDVDLHVLGDLSFDMSSIKGGLTQIISASELNIASEETAAENEGSAEENLMLIETVGPDQIAEDVSRWTGIPVTKLETNEKERLIGLAERLHRRVVGQDQAVEAVAEAVLRSRAGLGCPQLPTGSFLFLGPTGVGKTELAKALVEELFEDESFIVRIHMSEYMDQHSVSRLIGTPPGYVGHEEGGQLTEAVRRRPYSVVLFYEAEKAHSSVFNTLLQVLDDGRLTDGQGRTVDFTHSVIIMTSNLGAEHLLEGLSGKCPMETARELVMRDARRHFRPELLNRLDEIIVFDPLSHEQLKKVARLQMKNVATRLADRGIAIGVSDCALDVIVAKSYDPSNGARPIRRWLEKKVVTELSKMVLREEIDENSAVFIEATASGTDLSYRVEKNGGLVTASTGAKSDILKKLTEEDED